MDKLFLLFPHQLFQNIDLLKNKKVLLIEDPLFFTLYRFHIQKLVLHRASMRFYFDYLLSKGIDVSYYEDESYFNHFQSSYIEIYDVVDDWLLKKLKKQFSNLIVHKNPNFLNTRDQNKFLHKYYINRRKELNLFIADGKPMGGKWSYDSQNRKKLPKDVKIPLTLTYENKYIDEAKKYCEKFDSIGECSFFYYPITFDEAKLQLDYFLKNKFKSFGDYQDAITKQDIFLFHSNLSSSINIGLLNIFDIVDMVKDYDAPLNAKEGFVRQIIGWREFMLSIYKSSHVQLRTTNFFKFSKKIPNSLLEGSSGITPFDDAISILKKTAYNHHIQRLMILGNLFVLLEFDPDEVYRFFMSHYIDAYDWVMVGNLYGMSGFSDGGSITTKPYISSSNYIIKMALGYNKKDNWCKIWDGLYWRFLDKYGEQFAQNPRMKMQLSMLYKMDKEKLNNHKKIAQEFIDGL